SQDVENWTIGASLTVGQLVDSMYLRYSKALNMSSYVGGTPGGLPGPASTKPPPVRPATPRPAPGAPSSAPSPAGPPPLARAPAPSRPSAKAASAARDISIPKSASADPSRPAMPITVKNEYVVWYGTNRRQLDASDPTKGYSGERDNKVHYGSC